MLDTFHPDQLAAAYDMLRLCNPFCDWCLPHSDEIEFSVAPYRARSGWYLQKPNGDHHIAISDKHVGSLNTLIMVMAHEMIHLYQFINKTNTKHFHNANFRELAHEVCLIHSWDYKLFV